MDTILQQRQSTRGGCEADMLLSRICADKLIILSIVVSYVQQPVICWLIPGRQAGSYWYVNVRPNVTHKYLKGPYLKDQYLKGLRNPPRTKTDEKIVLARKPTVENATLT